MAATREARGSRAKQSGELAGFVLRAFAQGWFVRRSAPRA
jgi:hypothetical protein